MDVMDVPQELVSEFCGVTNAEEAVGRQLLADSNLDLSGAVSSYFAILDAGGEPPSAANAAPPTTPPTQPAEPAPAPAPAPLPAPAPVPLPPQAPAPLPAPASAAMPAHARPVPYSGALRAPRPAERPDSSAPNPFHDFVPGDVRGEGLAALFQPPTHLIYPNSLDEAQSAGQAQNRWILVNVQRNDVFACHTMNRDVWSDAAMQQLIAAHFLFWQRDDASAAPYPQFYNVANVPHVAVLDPRSGERVRVWGDDGQAIEKAFLIEQLEDFISGNSLESDAVIRGSQPRPGARAPRTADDAAPSAPESAAAAAGGGADAQQMEEDAMLAAAISASMEASDGSGDAAAGGAGGGGGGGGGGSGEGGGDADMGDGGANGLGPASSEREVSRLLSATDPRLSQSRSLRAEQDDAFRESLALDRAKEASQRSEQERLESERLAQELRERQRSERLEMKRKRVPDEPPGDTTDKVTELAIRMPNGKRVVRRFLASDNVGNVYDFLDTQCEELGDVEYELMLTYPRKSYSDREALLETLPGKAALVVHLKN